MRREGNAANALHQGLNYTENAVEWFQNQQVGDGFHNITRYGEGIEDENRKKSLGVVYWNWHPGEFICK
jgi:phage anti-repressor protein